MKNIFLLIALIAQISFSQNDNYKETEVNISKWIDGSLLEPNNNSKTLAIIIGGSGPTDRDGNQNFAKTNNLKKVALKLAEHDIASFRFDKRVVKQIKMNNINQDILFDDFVNDAVDVVNYFKTKSEFDKIYIIGHSQGSLIGMLAAKEAKIDGFISIAGAGQPIDKVLIDQIEATAPMFTEDTKRVIGILRSGETTTDYPVALASVFNISIQKFMMSWMKHDPAAIIANLDIPVLIINGTKDLQVSPDEAKLLHEASKTSELKIIDKMNHVLFIIEGDMQENAKSYNDQNGKISQEMMNAIIEFIKN